MTNTAYDSSRWLTELEAPALCMGGRDAAQAFLDRLKSQNVALDRLRFELAAEECAHPDEEVRAVVGV